MFARGVVLFVTIVFLSSPALAKAPPAKAPPAKVTTVEGITEYKLANGLRVLLAPDDSKPATTVNVTYEVGSRMEKYGETGMAHLLEHLMFKGTPKEPGKTIIEEFSKRGMRFNGSDLFRPHQLFRDLRLQRRQSGLGAEDGSRPHGPFQHRALRPRQRDDGGAQRDGDGREQSLSGIL